MAAEPAIIHRHSTEKQQQQINVASDHLKLLGSEGFLEQAKHPKHVRPQEQGNIFQASALHSKDVQGMPEGDSTRRCVKVVTYLNAQLRFLLLRFYFFSFFILDMNLQFVYVAFTGLGLQAGECCGEVSGPGKV
jgi:hypothetical protein